MPSRMAPVRLRQLAAIGVVLACAACATAPSAGGTASLKVGAIFPLSGPQAPLAKQQYAGVQIARDLANADGGIDGAPIELITRDLVAESDATARVEDLRAHGALADQLTGGGYPLVFRVGAPGTNLGTMASHFAAEVLAPRLSRAPSQLKMAIVHNLDGYPSSVAAAVRPPAGREGIQVVANVVYDAHAPDWTSVLDQVRAAQPNVLVLA